MGVGKTNLADTPRTSIDVRANICEGLCNALNDDNSRIMEKMRRVVIVYNRKL